MFDHIPAWVPTWAIFLMAVAGVACLTFWHWATFASEREAREIRDVESLTYRIPSAGGITVINRPMRRLQPILCMHCHHERNQRLGVHEPFPADARELTCHHHQVLLLEEQTAMLDRHNAERAEQTAWRPARLDPHNAPTPAVTAPVQPPHDIPLLFWASDGENGESVRAWTVQRLLSGGWVPPNSDDEDGWRERDAGQDNND